MSLLQNNLEDNSQRCTVVPSSVPNDFQSASEANQHDFVTCREIPYEPFQFWDDYRSQFPSQNIVVSSERLRALNPRILADFDENAEKILMEHDENDTSITVGEGDVSERILNEEVRFPSWIPANGVDSDKNNSNDSEIHSPEESFSDSDLLPYSCISDSFSSSGSEKYLTGVPDVGPPAQDNDSSTDSTSELLGKALSEIMEDDCEKSYLSTTSLIESDSYILSDSDNNSSDEDLFSLMDSKPAGSQQSDQSFGRTRSSSAKIKRRRVKIINDDSSSSDEKEDL